MWGLVMFEKEFSEKLKKEYENWKGEVLAPHLKLHPERKEEFSTSSIPHIKRVYSPLDIAETRYKDIGFPGKYPYTRGMNPTQYRSDIWIMGQYSGFGTAEEANCRYRYLIGKGSTGIGIAFDLPTQLGLDSDDPLSRYQVGVAGVAVDTIEDMRILLEKIPLEKIEVRAIANAQSSVILAMIVAIALERKVDLNTVHMEVMNDVLKEYTSRGNYIFPPDKGLHLSIDVIEYCLEHIPHCVSCKVCGYHMREAGCTAAQEVAFAIADGIAYVQEAIARGLDRNLFPSKFRFYFSCHRNIMEEVAKLRAARRLWAKVMKERFFVTDAVSQKMRLFTTSSGSTLATVEPYNNIIRIAFQALVGVLGGAEVMHLAAMDEGHALPTELSAKIALRTQQIIAYETGITDSVDPLGGSYMVEALTREIEDRAMEYIERIDRMGGAVAAIQQRYIQKEIARSAYEMQQKIDNREEVYVGVNRFFSEKDEKIPTFKVGAEVQKRQIEKLTNVKLHRDSKMVAELLEEVRNAARKGVNVMPSITSAVRGFASIGEVCGALRDVFGAHHDAAL